MPLWSTPDVDLNPLDNIADWVNKKGGEIEDAVSGYFSDTAGRLLKMITGDPKNLAGNVASSTPVGAGLMVFTGVILRDVFGKEELGEQLYKEGMEGILTFGKDEVLKVFLPPKFADWLFDKTLPVLMDFGWDYADFVPGSKQYRAQRENRERANKKHKVPEGVNVSPIRPEGVNFVELYFENRDPIIAEHEFAMSSKLNHCMRCWRYNHVTVQCWATTWRDGSPLTDRF